MSERDGYIPGVPCWVDTNQPDPAKAAEFYGGLFGWQLEESMPDGAEGSYLNATIRGGQVGAIPSVPEGAPAYPAWTPYITADDADATAKAVVRSGGLVVAEPSYVPGARTMANP